MPGRSRHARPASDAAHHPRLHPGELIAVASGFLLLAAMLLPWYVRDTDVAGVLFAESWNAWQILSAVAVLLFVIGVAAIAIPAARALWPPAADFRGEQVVMALGLLGAALVLLRLIDMPTPDIQPVPGDSVDTGRSLGLYLALVATLGIAYGGRRARVERARRPYSPGDTSSS
ncbi:MAG: hypothetical protein QOH58_3380 [Thermoleophilaceae bacterium]|jgi:hypothetical protein|nr:hypothetical protein [Thermoleophilaceae bacterium]